MSTVHSLSLMNSKTHKIISATYTTYTLYAVPIDWDVEDIYIKYGSLFYKQEEQYDVPNDTPEPDGKYPSRIEEGEFDLEDYFDCDEDAEEWKAAIEEEKEKEKQLNAVKTIIKYVYRYVLGYHEEADGYGRCDCGGGYNTQTLFWHYEENEYACLKCRDLAEEGDRHDICTDCYNRECECEKEEEE
jgi:hypothetical protein